MSISVPLGASGKRAFTVLGKANHGWLNANYHFSFASYHDPARMGWGNIRVWNDDEISAQSGFPTHAHDNMEIITYVREGAITHKDSIGNIGRTEAGDVQVMSAGTGVTHSEYNLENTMCRLFQIWILPREQNITPRWDARQFPKSNQDSRFTVLASGYGDEGALEINAEARVLGAIIAKDDRVQHTISPAHFAYLVLASGSVKIDGVVLNERDGFAITPGEPLSIEAIEDARLVLVESA